MAGRAAVSGANGGDENAVLVAMADQLANATQSRLPPNLRHWVNVTVLPGSLSSSGSIAHLETAIGGLLAAAERIAPAVRSAPWSFVVLGLPPFRVAMASGELRYTPKGDTVHACVENIVFIDIAKQAGIATPEVQIAVVLEELVHLLMNVRDEALVMDVVALLHDGIRVENGQYVPVPGD